MIFISGGSFIIIAVAVYALWRFVGWHRSGGDIAREFMVGMLFVYLLAVTFLTFFPMSIILYDWHGRFNFVPLASITELLRYTRPSTALTNIAGNIVMFVPLGILLPLLFRRLRSLGPLLVRVAVISLGIEILQLPTRVRATDVDDIILNVVGGALGYVSFRLAAQLTARSPRAAALLDRVGSDSKREPLAAGMLPVGVTLLLTAGLIGSAILSNTLNERAIRADAVSGLTNGAVVATADAASHVILLARDDSPAAEGYQYSVYKRVLPRRYTKVSLNHTGRKATSFATIATTSWNPRAEEGPAVFVVGRNDSGASTLVVTGEQRVAAFGVPASGYFAFALPTDSGLDAAMPTLAFYDPSGRDVTDLFEQAR